MGLGPIAQALDSRSFGRVHLLSNYARPEVEPYLAWLRERTGIAIEVVYEELSSPTEFGEIYRAAGRVLTALAAEGRGTRVTIHLSPGTPAMAAVWILLAKTRFSADLIESSREHGLKDVHLPFDIAVDFLPDILREQDERLRALSGALPPEAPEFAAIIHRSRAMVRLIQRARRVAMRDVPVLIEGESGTGKELLARAIHGASARAGGSFVAVNCGAIPAELVESELFGHDRGAFTGATRERAGYFQEADGGTLFLDELGELPGQAQVKLLRALEQGEIVRVGSSKPVRVDVRVIAATNRTLTDEIAAGRFREDLFYRLAVAVLKLPPLRERSEDLGLLIDRLLDQVNREAEGEPGYRPRKLSAGARNLLMGHSWPGNVRELLNTLRRAAIWSEGATVTVEDVREALLPLAVRRGDSILDRPLGNGLDLEEVLTEVSRHYLTRAMKEAGGNKSKAAQLVGLASYQTLSNWLRKYGVDE